MTDETQSSGYIPPVEAEVQGVVSAEAKPLTEQEALAEQVRQGWRAEMDKLKARTEEEGAFIAVIGNDPEHEALMFPELVKRSDGKTFIVGLTEAGPIGIESQYGQEVLETRILKSIAVDKDGFYASAGITSESGKPLGWHRHKGANTGDLAIGGRTPDKFAHLLADQDDSMITEAMKKSMETAAPSKKQLERAETERLRGQLSRIDTVKLSLDAIPPRPSSLPPTSS